jgi:hypothetical protein
MNEWLAYMENLTPWRHWLLACDLLYFPIVDSDMGRLLLPDFDY